MKDDVSPDTVMSKLKQIKGLDKLMYHAVLLYVLLMDADTPTWVKAIVIGALAYLVNPVDAIPDAIPIVGYTDDLAVLISAIASIKHNIRPHHERQATEIIKTI